MNATRKLARARRRHPTGLSTSELAGFYLAVANERGLSTVAPRYLHEYLARGVNVPLYDRPPEPKRKPSAPFVIHPIPLA